MTSHSEYLFKHSIKQVCCESTSHAEEICDSQQAEHGKLVDLLCVLSTIPALSTELATMSTNHTHPAEKYHTEEEQIEGVWSRDDSQRLLPSTIAGQQRSLISSI